MTAEFGAPNTSSITIEFPGGKAKNGMELTGYKRTLVVLSATSEVVSAVDIDGDLVGLYSFFLKEQVLFFTQHRHNLGAANSVSLWARCVRA